MESIAVPISLTLELRPEGTDLGSLERAVGSGLAEAGVAMWVTLIERLEADLPEPAGCRHCGGVLKANGRAPRRIVTLAGEVELSRRRYRCTACDAEVVPLDEALEELRHLPVSHGQLHRWVLEEGARIEAEVAAETEAILGVHPERAPTAEPLAGDVWMQADGTMVHGRSGHEFEVKLGLVFTDAEQVGKDRRRLLDRHYVGATGSWTTFAERFTAACAGDGRLRGGAHPLRVGRGHGHPLDLRSAPSPTRSSCSTGTTSSRTSAAASARPTEEVLSTAVGAAAPGDVAALLAILRSHARALEPDDPEQAERCREVIGYVENNRRAIANCRIVPLASSGPMEKGVDITILPPLQGPGHELVPPGRQPPAASEAPPPERHLGSLLGRAPRGGHPSLAVSGVSQHRRLDSSGQHSGWYRTRGRCRRCSRQAILTAIQPRTTSPE